jgi:hypothetical protein
MVARGDAGGHGDLAVFAEGGTATPSATVSTRSSGLQPRPHDAIWTAGRGTDLHHAGPHLLERMTVVGSAVARRWIAR